MDTNCLYFILKQLVMDYASSNQHSLNSESYYAQPVRRNTLIFAILMIFLQIGLSLIYGFLINISTATLNTSSAVITIGLAILVIAGFGLVFGYTRKLVWSGIGFTFFITALSIELYPLVNDFWTKVGLQSNNTPTTNFDQSNKSYSLYLTNKQTSNNGLATFYGNSITNALKCALSIAIGFSAILGRAGQLECLVVTCFGVIGFELNRQIIQQNQGVDTFGSFYIFTFGGFLGLGLGLWSFLRQKKAQYSFSRSSLSKYTGSEHSTLYAIFGSLIIFALFPLLAYEIDGYSRYSTFSPYSNPVCIIIALGAGGIGAIMTSCLINGYIIARDALHGPIAGAIAVGASSLYITNPVYALVAGATGGIIQVLIQNIFQKAASKRRVIISTVSWSLFGIQGIVGAAFASGWKAILYTSNNGMTVENATLYDSSSQFEFYGGLISAGIGAAFGLGIGVIVFLVNGQESRQYFNDYYYWLASDGIRFHNQRPAKQQPQKALPLPQKPKPVEVQIYSDNQFDFSQPADADIPNPYAYL